MRHQDGIIFWRQLLFSFTCTWTVSTGSKQGRLAPHRLLGSFLIMVCTSKRKEIDYDDANLQDAWFSVGCDAFAVHLILINLITSLQLVHDWKSIMSALYVFIPWWLAHWEEYHTGVMLYGSGLWGVTEANYAVCLVHLFTYIVGPAGWTWTPFSFLGTRCDNSINFIERLCSFISGLQVNDALLLTFGFMGASLFLQQVVRVFKLSGSDTLLNTTLPTEERGHKDLGFMASGSHLLQILWTCIGCGTILILPIVPPSHSRIVFEIFGINYAWQATRMIMAHMSKESFQIAILPNILIMLQILNFFVEAFEPTGIAYAVLAGTAVGYLQYILSVISEICAFLGISALTIKARKMD